MTSHSYIPCSDCGPEAEAGDSEPSENSSRSFIRYQGLC